MLKHELDGFSQQMGPTKLVLVEQILVSSIIVRYSDAPELLADNLLGLCFTSTYPTAKQYVHGGRKSPSVTRLLPNFPPCLIDIDNQLLGQQLSYRIVLRATNLDSTDLITNLLGISATTSP